LIDCVDNLKEKLTYYLAEDIQEVFKMKLDWKAFFNTFFTNQESPNSEDIAKAEFIFNKDM
jgi:hypothetical protein